MFKHCVPKSVDALTLFLISNGFIGGVNEANEGGIRPLHAALLLSNSGNSQGLSLLKELLNQGANPLLESTDNLKLNAACLAAAHGLVAEFQSIIQKYPDAKVALSGADNKLSPFAFAILNFNKHIEKSTTFMNAFKDSVDMSKNLAGQDVPPLIFAVINDQVEAIKYFIDAGASLVVGPNDGWNIAHWAAAFGCFKSFALICELKPELAVTPTEDGNQWNPLTISAVHAKLRPDACKAFIKQLSDQEYNIDMPNGALDNPLMISAWGAQSLPGVQKLLECGANPDLPYKPLIVGHPNAGKTAFILATQLKFNGEPQDVRVAESTRSKILVELINSHKFHVEANSYNGYTAFSWALEANSTDALDAINAKTPQDLGAKDPTGQTYLQWTVGSPKYSLGTCKWLIDHGSDVNIEYDKMTQLPDGRLVKTAVKRTAFSDICEQFTNTNMTPGDALIQKAKAEYIMNSQTFTAKFSANDADGDGFNVIHWAISLKDSKIVHDLCTKYSTLVNEKDNNGNTALKWTAVYYNQASNDWDKESFKNIAAELVSHGAEKEDLAVTDLFGFNAAGIHEQLSNTYVAQSLAPVDLAGVETSFSSS